MMTSIKKPESI